MRATTTPFSHFLALSLSLSLHSHNNNTHTHQRRRNGGRWKERGESARGFANFLRLTPLPSPSLVSILRAWCACVQFGWARETSRAAAAATRRHCNRGGDGGSINEAKKSLFLSLWKFPPAGSRLQTHLVALSARARHASNEEEERRVL